uniref:Xylanolytic transcriptional activator regulatory domain-containing protein n=2 Tax=Kalmanozyma brasiliensis (strain GHG001) TaxID=1365824 RepID=V5EU74_KALBG
MVLLEVFFRDINPLMFPFDEVWFREALHGAVDVIWGEDEGYGQDGPNQLSVIAALFAVLALTLLSQPPSMGGQEEGAAQAAKMAFHCRNALMLAESVACNDAFGVLAQLLLARYMILLRQAKESWLVLGAAVRQAQALGLHRLGPPSEAEGKEVQMRRVIWSHLFFEDRFSSLIVGQAPLVHDAFCTTTLGPNSTGARERGRFELVPILRIREEMTGIVGRMLELYFSNSVDLTYEAILQLDAQLNTMANSLTSPYRRDEGPPEGPDGRTIALHRYILHVSLAYLQLSLHLPYLRRGSAERGFERSRASTLQAAIWDHQARQELSLLTWPPHIATDAFVGGRFFHFHATSALGVCLLTEPDLARVSQLVGMMDEFLSRAEESVAMKGVDPNRCIRQEIGIVSLIRGRVRRRLAEGEVHRTNHIEMSQEQGANTTEWEVEGSEVGLMPEMGQDVYEWWSWLVASLTPEGGLEPAPGGEP